MNAQGKVVEKKKGSRFRVPSSGLAGPGFIQADLTLLKWLYRVFPDDPQPVIGQHFQGVLEIAGILIFGSVGLDYSVCLACFVFLVFLGTSITSYCFF